MHTDKEIKDWVCAHISQLLKEDRDTDETEFKASITIPDERGVAHPYTVFLEQSELDGKEEWVVRNIVRPEQLQ
ncbi:hypothetical protein [Olivibacter sp. XZL3]|uniref:hypothetical protein n=1 Tax=Olivibacter sp. XZL3 TaxID=1735116 RepID=UPI001065A208|nr:hypothetical protein [Olivibacter sp. XZL3]